MGSALNTTLGLRVFGVDYFLNIFERILMKEMLPILLM
jgi:hypothetical protein